MIRNSDKRDHHRMAIETQAEYLPPNSSQYSQCKVCDLSATGMLLMTREAVNQGEMLKVRITPDHPITPTFDADIEAVRCSEKSDGDYEVACKIIKIH